MVELLEQISQLEVTVTVIEIGLTVEHTPGKGLLFSFIELIIFRHILIDRVKCHFAPLIIVHRTPGKGHDTETFRQGMIVKEVRQCWQEFALCEIASRTKDD